MQLFNEETIKDACRAAMSAADADGRLLFDDWWKRNRENFIDESTPSSTYKGQDNEDIIKSCPKCGWDLQGATHLQECDYVEPSVASTYKEEQQSQREKIVDILNQHITSDIYFCTRVWEAWQVGTMTEDDFEQVNSDMDFINNLADALVSTALHHQGGVLPQLLEWIEQEEKTSLRLNDVDGLAMLRFVKEKIEELTSQKTEQGNGGSAEEILRRVCNIPSDVELHSDAVIKLGDAIIAMSQYANQSK